MSGFRKVSEDIVYAGSLISVARGRFEAPDGTAFERDVVHHPGAVAVVPVTDDGTALMVRQYRAAVDRVLLEIPAGKRDVAGEPPIDTARRELAEEVGMQAASLELLTTIFNSPGFCDEEMSVYLARKLTAVPLCAQGIEEQHMTIEPVAFDQVPALIATGEIVDAKSIIGLVLARDLIERSRG